MIDKLFRTSGLADDLLSAHVGADRQPVSQKPGPRPFVAGKTYRVKTASLSKHGFRKVAENLLVNLASEDFWEVKQDKSGNSIIRKISDDSLPVED